MRDGKKVLTELDADGLPEVGARLHKEQKILRIELPQTNSYRVLRYENNMEFYVLQVVPTSNDDVKLVSVLIKFRITRNPTIGDKFSSHHGQKGVFSFPWIEQDMPITESGIRPDVIINPHALPFRMTIGILIESMSGNPRFAGPFMRLHLHTAEISN